MFIVFPSLYQQLFNFLRLKAINGWINKSRNQTIKHNDNNTDILTDYNSQIQNQSGKVVKADNKEL